MNLRILSTSLLVAAAFALPARSNAAASISLFNGKDLTGWKLVGGKSGASQWKVGKAALDPANPAKLAVAGAGTELISPTPGANLSSEQSFGDCTLEMEFMMATNSNSGVKLMNIYEVQMFDSYGKAKPDSSDCGAIYKEAAPLVNACLKPGEWQTLTVEFRAPRFDASGAKTANAKFEKVVLNGKVVQQDVEVAHGTNVGRNAKEHPTGPIYLQGDHGPVAFRNLKITPR